MSELKLCGDHNKGHTIVKKDYSRTREGNVVIDYSSIKRFLERLERTFQMERHLLRFNVIFSWHNKIELDEEQSNYMLYYGEVSLGFTEFFQKNDVYNPSGVCCCLLELYGYYANDPNIIIDFHVGFYPENVTPPKPETFTEIHPNEGNVSGFLYLPLGCLKVFLDFMQSSSRKYVWLDDSWPESNYIEFS